MPNLEAVVETCIHVDDLPRAIRFYEHVLGLRKMAGDARFAAFAVPGGQVFLLFLRGATSAPVSLPGGVIPAHGGSGVLHVGFGVSAAELPAWEARLAACGVEVESRMRWDRGGTSLYFRDPDGHLLELLTPGVWENH